MQKVKSGGINTQAEQQSPASGNLANLEQKPSADNGLAGGDEASGGGVEADNSRDTQLRRSGDTIFQCTKSSSLPPSQKCLTQIQDCPETRPACPENAQQYPFQTVSGSFSSSPATDALRALDENSLAGGEVPTVAAITASEPDSASPSTTSATQTNRSGKPIHSCSQWLARKCGLAAAALAQYLAVKIDRSKNFRNGAPFYYASARELSLALPYLGRKAIDGAVEKLKDEEVILVKNYNKHPGDKTRWFSMNPEQRRQLIRPKDPIFFGTEDAKKYGINTAVLLYHLERRSWNQEDHPEFSPTWLSEFCGLGRSTVYRILGELVEDGVLAVVPSTSGSTSYSVLDQPDRKRLLPPHPPAPTVTIHHGTSSGAPASGVTPLRPYQRTDVEFRNFQKLNVQFFRCISDADLDRVTACARDIIRSLRDEDRVALYGERGHTDRLLQAARRILDIYQCSCGDFRTLVQEAIVVAFARPYVGTSIVRAKWADLGLEQQKLASAILRRREEEAYDQAKRSSRDYERESDVVLNPAEKEEVLRRGIDARNGAPRRNPRGTPQPLIGGPTGLYFARRFFETNPSFSCRLLLDLMERAVSLSEPEYDYDHHWHARRAFELRFLIEHIEKVLAELGLVDDLQRLSPQTLSQRS